MKKQIWVSPDDGDWKVKSVGAGKAVARFELKSNAIEKAREIALNNHAELIVQNQDGEIGWRNSYGNDPCPPRG